MLTVVPEIFRLGLYLPYNHSDKISCSSDDVMSFDSRSDLGNQADSSMASLAGQENFIIDSGTFRVSFKICNKIFLPGKTWLKISCLICEIYHFMAQQDLI